MRRQAFAGALALAATVGLASPAAAQSRREMQMMADIRMLQEQTQLLQQQLTAALAQIADALKQLNARVDDQVGATRKGFADQKLTVDQVGGDLRVVKERVDETNVRITSLSQEIEALRLAIPAYPPTPTTLDPNADPTAMAGAGAGGVPPGPGTAAPGPVAGGAPAGPVAAPGISPQRLFDTAWTDYTAGQWTLCIEGFSTYVRTFPRNDAAGDAQFYIGECFYADGKFPEALDNYNRVIANYPRGARVPEAYYKRGLTFERMNQPDQARDSWETLLKQYPDSEMARLGRQNLDRLARRPPAR